MKFSPRIYAAFYAAGIHAVCSLLVAVLAAVLVFGLWYPYPYRELSGGRDLFLLVVAVDVVCGPLLTMVIFNPAKKATELWRDLTLVALIQLAALAFGILTVWQARPLFLVLEVDRFKVVMAHDVDKAAVAALPAELKPNFWDGPRIVATRRSVDIEEKNRILFSVIEGGRDYAERPEFYLPYEGDNALKSLKSAKALDIFLQRWPEQISAATVITLDKKLDTAQLLFLPVVGRQDWVAVLDKYGQIHGYLKGDGF